MSIRVLLADDHKLFRQGMISLMRTREDLVEVVGEAETGEEAIQLTEKLSPDVVLMDIYMSQMDGLQAAKEIRTRFPKVAIVMLTSSERDGHLYEAVRLGVAGYLLKSLDADELFELLEGVTRGEAAMTRSMAMRLLKGVADRMVDGESGEEALSEKELLVLRFVASGASNAEIAESLSISINTVKSHLKNILEKLQLANRTQAATYALKHGLVLPREN
ncbi:MAG: response regulator transcription factor [Anaerolineales bacterium]|jgi:DNA-binding NarL/FixJ family response regulator|nr:Response regulator protein VraR [Anaerolineales bacterium]MCZ7549502.1 response regulator transcription factor [Anaerolineales bacterium]GER80139.1 DNA-binding response regulator, NarL/FixJ family [Candidatus Denitrolinea symbiosum]GER80621.1 DNA-binding response regulator, NarL/FixJ family [Candidatus Denitrolinea symbiosum]HPP62578.1 response regulator transcription factor [Anaerolineales bacterium]